VGELFIGKVTYLRVGSYKFNSLCVNCSSVWYYPAGRVACGNIFDTQFCVDLISIKSSVLQSLFSIRDYKTVVVVCSDHIVGRQTVCEQKTRSSSLFSVAGVGVETHLCVRTFLT